MPFPKSSRLELPILQELKATGGREKVKFLYRRLVPYFPQLAEADLIARTKNKKSPWKRLVQRAGDTLVQKKELERSNGQWTLTEAGRKRAEEENMLVPPIRAEAPIRPEAPTVSHNDIKKKLAEIGRMLGKYAQEEYQRYDVVWKESELSPRMSHVFEVQVRGKLESALTKLKHAYDVQRSKPFLIIAEEKDSKKAVRFLQPYLSGSFHEIGNVTTVLSVQEIERVYLALQAVKGVLDKVLDR